MRPFTSEQMRYEYPLNAESFVLDAGGYEGQFAEAIWNLYQPRILIFEPVKAFADRIEAKFKDNSKIGVFHGGLGGSDCGAGKDIPIHIQNNSSGIFASSANSELGQFYAASYVVHGLEHTIDLLKLNIEGLEFDVLENLLDHGKMDRIVNLQIQFHGIPGLNPVERWKKIRESLAETHELEWADPSMEFRDNTWESWKKR